MPLTPTLIAFSLPFLAERLIVLVADLAPAVCFLIGLVLSLSSLRSRR